MDLRVVTEKIEKFVTDNMGTLSKVDSAIKTGLGVVDEIVREAVANAQKVMRPVPVKVKRLENFKGELPAYQSPLASGFDVRAQLEAEVTLNPGERALIATGLSFEIPDGYEIQARPRSGLAIKSGISLVNTPGTIDADYRGEVKIILINLGREPFLVKDQDRIAQLVLCPVVQAQLVESVDLSDSQRGAGGFGSTGV